RGDGPLAVRRPRLRPQRGRRRAVRPLRRLGGGRPAPRRPRPTGAGAPAAERRRGVDGGVGTRAGTGAADRVGRLWVLALTLGVVAVFASWFGPLQILLPAQTDRIEIGRASCRE